MKLRIGRAEWFLGSAILFIVGSGIILFVMFIQIDSLSLSLRSNYWATSQTEVDFLRLSKSLELYVANAPEASYEDVRLRMDILFSRLKVIASADVEPLLGLPEHIEILRILNDMLVRLDALTADPSFRDGSAGRVAIALMDEAWFPLHGWARQVIHGELWINQRGGIIDGQRRMLILNGVLLVASLVAVVGIFVLILRHRDLAMREHQARLKAEMASASQARFLASVSHELRTPLNAIIGFSELLMMRIYGSLNQKQEDYLADIRMSGNVLLSLINDILTYSKLDAEMPGAVIESVNLNDVIRDGVKFLQPTFIARGGQIDVSGSDISAMVRTDRRLALQCVANLLSNASKFSPRNGVIEIVIAAKDQGYEVRVRDHGPGMKPEEIAQAGEPFRQFTDPFRRGSGGTGLGLALTKRFCLVIGATMRIAAASGGGLEVTLWFPMDVPKSSADGTVPNQNASFGS